MDKKKLEEWKKALDKRRTDMKRERIAAMTLSALIAKRDFTTLNDTDCVEFLTSLAVAYADELIMKLDSTEFPSESDVAG